MEYIDIFKYLQEQIHTVVIATLDSKGLPVTCAIDLMDFDEKGLYFLTAKGKNFFHRLCEKDYLSLTGIKGKDTLSCVAVSLRGKVKETKEAPLDRLLTKNPYMYEIYPSRASQDALTVFQIFEGSIEWFDLSKKPIERFTFSFGNTEKKEEGYFVTQECIACKKCLEVCPQNCIKLNLKAYIEQTHCLHCGNCERVCPKQAIKRMR